MSISTKRIAAVAAASALGLSGAFAATEASAQSKTPDPSTSAKPTASSTPSKPAPDAKATSAAPPRASETPQLKQADFQGPDGKGNPTYSINSSTGVSTSKGRLATSAGAPIANATITLYNFTGDKRGQQFGQATTAADGSFTLTATIPAAVRSQDYNLEMNFKGNAQAAETSVTLHLPKATPTPGAPTTAAPTTKPTTKPTTPGKKPGLPSTGAEGMPVLPALASLTVLAAGAAVVLRRK